MVLVNALNDFIELTIVVSGLRQLNSTRGVTHVTHPLAFLIELTLLCLLNDQSPTNRFVVLVLIFKIKRVFTTKFINLQFPRRACQASSASGMGTKFLLQMFLKLSVNETPGVVIGANFTKTEKVVFRTREVRQGKDQGLRLEN